MQRLVVLPLVVLAGPAFAHPGHIAEAAGHSHFLALGSVAAIAIIALAVARSLSRRRKAALSD